MTSECAGSTSLGARLDVRGARPDVRRRTARRHGVHDSTSGGAPLGVAGTRERATARVTRAPRGRRRDWGGGARHVPRCSQTSTSAPAPVSLEIWGVGLPPDLLEPVRRKSDLRNFKCHGSAESPHVQPRTATTARQSPHRRGTGGVHLCDDRGTPAGTRGVRVTTHASVRAPAWPRAAPGRSAPVFGQVAAAAEPTSRQAPIGGKLGSPIESSLLKTPSICPSTRAEFCPDQSVGCCQPSSRDAKCVPWSRRIGQGDGAPHIRRSTARPDIIELRNFLVPAPVFGRALPQTMLPSPLLAAIAAVKSRLRKKPRWCSS